MIEFFNSNRVSRKPLTGTGSPARYRIKRKSTLFYRFDRYLFGLLDNSHKYRHLPWSRLRYTDGLITSA